MDGLMIKRAAQEELPSIVRALSQEWYFVDRLDRQRRDLGVLLVAWLGGEPVGDAYLWFEEAFEAEVARHLPGTPLLSHLEVRPVQRRRGIGTALVERCERELKARGHRQVALGVGVENKDARRLYERLGYAEWRHGLVQTISEVFASDGTRSRVLDDEASFILMKNLHAAPAR